MAAPSGHSRAEQKPKPILCGGFRRGIFTRATRAGVERSVAGLVTVNETRNGRPALW